MGTFNRVKGLRHRWMPNLGTLLAVIVLLWAHDALVASGDHRASGSAWPATTTIYYQGRLTDGDGTPVEGSVALAFSLYDSGAGDTPLWGPENHSQVPVSDGLFSVRLGSQTAGGIPTDVLVGDLWLEVAVDGETLQPRERLGVVPFAMQALTVPQGAIDTAQLAEGAVTPDKAPLLVRALDGAGTRVQSGVLSKYTAGTYGEDVPQITFAEPFTAAPQVMLTNCTASDEMNWDELVWSVKETSTTGFTAHYHVGVLTAGTYKACWFAIGQ